MAPLTICKRCRGPSGSILDVDDFIANGFTCVRQAIDPDLAGRVAAQAWSELGVDPLDRATWPGPVAHRGLGGDLVREAAASPMLCDAIDKVAGAGQWRATQNLGLFVARFPTGEDSKDWGWHIDSSFHPQDLPWPEGREDWSVNVHSRGRALLLLPLWTEVGEGDAPTRIRVGSHLDTAAALAPFGSEGVRGPMASPLVDECSKHREVVFATGSPGDVYLCHPFLVHAAQLHRGTSARLISQPGIQPTSTYALVRPQAECVAVERAILTGLNARESDASFTRLT